MNSLLFKVVFSLHLKYSYYEQSLAVAISTSAVKTTCRMFASLPPCLRLSSSTVWRHNRKYANWPVRLDNGNKKNLVSKSNVNTAAAAKTEKYSYMGCIIHICKLCLRKNKTVSRRFCFLSSLFCFTHTWQSSFWTRGCKFWVTHQSHAFVSNLQCIIHTLLNCNSRAITNNAMYAYFDKTKEKRPSVISQICG